MADIADNDGGFMRQLMFDHLNDRLTLQEALDEAYLKGYRDGRG